MNLAEWLVFASMMEDVIFFHSNCGFSYYPDHDENLESITTKLEEHSKECKK